MLTAEDIAKVHSRVPAVPLEEYAERYKEYLKLERTDGILVMTMHYEGGSAKWVHGLHNALGSVLKFIGADKENGVLIITGAGDTWLGGLDPEYMVYMQEHSAQDHLEYAKTTYDDWYSDGRALLQNILFDIDIPTIAAVNGNYAAVTGLNPLRDGILAEGPEGPYVCNIVVDRKNVDAPWVKPLVKAYQDPSVAAWIREFYKGTVIPGF